MGFENLSRAPDVRQSSDRSFGIVFGGFFLIVALLPLLRTGGLPRVWALLVSAVFFLVAVVAPRLLSPLNDLWLRLGSLLHRVVSPIVLGMLFFLVVTPTGLVMRLLGRDLLTLRRDPREKSYWIARRPPGPPPDSFQNQF